MGHRNVEWTTSFLSLLHFHLMPPIPDNFHLSSLGLTNSAVLPIIWNGNIWMFLFLVWSNIVAPRCGGRIRTVAAMDTDIWARTQWCRDFGYAIPKSCLVCADGLWSAIRTLHFAVSINLETCLDQIFSKVWLKWKWIVISVIMKTFEVTCCGEFRNQT